MYDFLLNDEQKKLREEVRDFVRWVPRAMIVKMDRDEIRFPKEFLQEAGRRNLLGCRHPKEWGGRHLDWVSACMVMEEIGTLGYIFACTFGVGAELVCDAIIQHGTEAQKEKYVRPLLRGDLFAAEGLTEPRGGSDFFGTAATAADQGDHFVLNGQKRFIVGAEGADFFLVYARTNPDAKPSEGITAFIVDRGPGVTVEYLYGLMGSRGGGTGRVVFHDVRVPKENAVGKIDGGVEVFNTMMIPERLGTAAMTIGPARGPGGRRRLHHPPQGLRPDDQPLRGRELPGGRGLHAPRCRPGAGLHHRPGGGRGRGTRPHPPVHQRDQEVRHRVLPEGGAQRHAGHGRHRLHRRVPSGAPRPRPAPRLHLDRHQRGDEHDHRPRVVHGVRRAARAEGPLARLGGR
jgi:hypothetical protein